MDEKIINNIKSLGVEMISNAKSGHTGIVLSAAPIIYTVYAKHMNISTSDAKWPNRDRFIMSAGHGSTLLYATLHLAGFDILLEDLKNFRRVNFKTPGHPEWNYTDGVDMSTGPLGQGLASSVGMAIAEKIIEEKYVFPSMGKFSKGKSLFDYKIYALCGDGDLMEGISYEAASLAGNLNLDNIIILYDSNNVSLDGDTSNTFTENVLDRFKSLGWYTDYVKNGNDVTAIDRAITKAKTCGKPAIIEIKTVLGYDTAYAGSNEIHGKPLTKDEVRDLKIKLSIPDVDFYVDPDYMQAFRKMITERSGKKYGEWSDNFKKYVDLYLNGEDTPFAYLFRNEIETNILNFDFNFKENIKKESTRDLNAVILNGLADAIPNFLGGSADLATSTRTTLKKFNDIKDGHYDGKNIWFGVREHAMGAILNGLALSNFRPFGSTFLTFSDYLKPAIRLSALMKLPVTYIFTHDTIAIGEDGPTHQPIEQLATLRATPNLNVFRPADKEELIGCWNEIINANSNPNALILSKQELEPLIGTKKEEVQKGAYIVRKENRYLHGIVIATGSEVYTALILAEDLYRNFGLDIRVVSMPCMELYSKQPEEYKKQLFPLGYKTIVLEAGSSFGWHQFVYNKNYLITIDEFGVSGTRDEVLKHMKFDYNSIREKIVQLLK